MSGAVLETPTASLQIFPYEGFPSLYTFFPLQSRFSFPETVISLLLMPVLFPNICKLSFCVFAQMYISTLLEFYSNHPTTTCLNLTRKACILTNSNAHLKPHIKKQK
ncbi:UNVERIFIED_CONTAM: hypothetical protein K2H54_009173 [Gekko kuhli]